MFYLGVLLRTTAQDTASQKALEQLLERQGRCQEV